MEGGTGLREVVVVVGRVATKVKGVCYYVGKGLLPPPPLQSRNPHILQFLLSTKKCLYHPLPAGKHPGECISLKGRVMLIHFL